MPQGFLFATFLAASLMQAIASAASFIVEPRFYAPTNVYSFYVDGETSNGAFDAIFFQAKSLRWSLLNPDSGAVAGAPRLPGAEFTYPNRMLTANPDDFPGGLGLFRFDLVNNGLELSFTVAQVGGMITTSAQPNGDLFLANVFNSSGGAFSYDMQILLGGTVVDRAGGVLPYPEPCGMTIAGVGLIGLLCSRRLRRPQG